MYELSAFPENDYTDDGQLLGHIVMGCEIIGKAADKIDGFPDMLERELKHCIVAHHFADDMDAKLETLKEALNTPAGQNGEWTGFNKMLDSNIRKTII